MVVLPSFRARLLDRYSELFESTDTSTEVGRAKERRKRIALTACASLFAKMITVTTGLVSVPLTLHYLGVERYGMWMTMSTLIAVLSFADFGIGNGLLSIVARAHGNDDRGTIRASISSAYVVLSGIALTVLILFAPLYSLIDWARIFNVSTPRAQAEVGPALATLVVCFSLAIPLGVVQRTQMGLQRGFMASLWQCFDSALGLLAVLIAIRLEAPLPYLVAGFAGAPLIASLFNNLLFFGLLQPDLAPRLGFASWAQVRAIAGTGFLFFILQVVSVVTYASDGIIIAQLLGASAVSEYAVPQKLFGFIGTILAMLLAPLWPAYGEAIARGDHSWVRRTLRQSIILSLCSATLMSLILVSIGHLLIAAWVGPIVVAPFSLMVGFGVWKVVEAGGAALAAFLNGAHIVNAQIAVSIATCAAAVFGKILLIQLIGISGAIWATVAAFLIFAALPYSLLLRKFIATTQN